MTKTHRLSTRCTGITRRDNAWNIANVQVINFSTKITHSTLTYQIPTAVLLMHQRAAGIALAGILAAIAIAGAQHLLVDDDIDAILSMPALADAILNHGHIDSLQSFGAQAGAWIQGAPAGGPAILAQKVLVLLRQTNWRCGRCEVMMVKRYRWTTRVSILYIPICGMKCTVRSRVNTETSKRSACGVNLK